MKHSKKGITALVIGSLGVVFGDIGTSPLYALQAVFGTHGERLAINSSNVFGIISLVIWSITIVVSVKYVGFIMRADNEGEGGIMALIARIKSSKLGTRYSGALIFLGLIGVALFYGDSAITPAISVLSAVEGLRVIAPDLAQYVLPITLVVLTCLFGIQKYGTQLIGRLFGPVMLVWFVVIAVGGAYQVWQHPDVLIALSPLTAINFFINQPLIAFIAMGAVVLVVTGAEALYADMGHFGRQPIARAWFLLVFPALILCYIGQGALLVNDPQSITSPFFLLFPAIIHVPLVLLAVLATLIASQAVISGAFSLTRQAVHLNFLPRLSIRHTSLETGQVYLPFINVSLFLAVTLLVLIFHSSNALANAYGMAVSATLAIDTILFVVVANLFWKKSRLLIAAAAMLIFLPVDMLFVSSNLSKLSQGGWIPLLIAFVILVIISTWISGQRIVVKKRRAMEGSLQAYIDKIGRRHPPLTRISGYAVYIGHHADLAPLALHATVEKLHELHEKVVIVSVRITNSAHIPEEKRANFNSLGYSDGISHLELSYGFHDTPNIPKALKYFRHISPELDFDANRASYFVSLVKVVPSRLHNLAHWRKALYCLMSRNALSASDYYKLPIDRTVEMRSLIKL